MNDFKILYFTRNENEFRQVTVNGDYFRINGGKRHEDFSTYLETITLKGWKETDFYGYLEAKRRFLCT